MHKCKCPIEFDKKRTPDEINEDPNGRIRMSPIDDGITVDAEEGDLGTNQDKQGIESCVGIGSGKDVRKRA
eukprot:13707845-Heterocapsa_arctica.AAC.1